jgi:small subunit ribosomal protein S2
MIKLPTTEELLEAAVQNGHSVSKSHPKMKPYFHSIKGGINLIDLEKTKEGLQKAAEFIKTVAAKNGKILFVGTKPAAQAIIKKYAEQVDMPYVVERWLGGIITNFSVIHQLINKLKKMEEEKEKGDWGKYTKKEKLNLEKEVARLNLFVGGLKNLERLPDVLYIVGLHEEKTAVREAKKAKIKSVGIADANNNPEDVSFPIPANDDATRSIDLITGVIAQAIKEGQAEAKSNPGTKSQS